jgi:regulatory protein
MPTAPSLKARALRLLAQREHSRSELRRKLLAHALQAEVAKRPPPDDGSACGDDVRAAATGTVDELLDALEAAGHLSEARFVESRVHCRAPRFGRRRIEAELARHGLEIGAAANCELAASEVERAREVWTRRFGVPAHDARERARQMRFLAGRGFDGDVIRRVVPPATGAEDDV